MLLFARHLSWHVINRLEIVWTESNPLSLTLSPSPGGEGRVRGRPCLYNCATLNNWIPAFAGMTENGIFRLFTRSSLFTTSSKFDYSRYAAPLNSFVLHSCVAAPCCLHPFGLIGKCRSNSLRGRKCKTGRPVPTSSEDQGRNARTPPTGAAALRRGGPSGEAVLSSKSIFRG